MKKSEIDQYLQLVREVEATDKQRTPGPYRWWTSNSLRRLSSDATGKDGDIAYATIATDGVPDIVVREEDMKYIEVACNKAPHLCIAVRHLIAIVGYFERREQDIIDAIRPADGGRWRSDIVSAIERQRRELVEAKAEIEVLKAQLTEARRGT